VGRLAVVELARETHPPLAVALDLDPRAPREAREMVVSLGASLLVYGLGEGREVKACAGPENPPFPEEVSRDSILTWCAGLRASSAPDPGGTSVEVRPSTRRFEAERTAPSPPPGASEAQAVVLVSCHEFSGVGPWMSPEEELEFMDKTGANGRLVAHVGVRVEEPWRIA
jgi:hypothetical protein